MADLKYNFLNNNFTIYKPSTLSEEEILSEFPLIDDISDLEPFGISNIESFSKKNPVIKKRTPKIINNNNPEQPIHTTQQEQPINNNIEVRQDKIFNNSVINSIMQRLQLTPEQAAGIAGVIMSESGLNPKSYNKAEKSGNLKGSSANGKGYGAGLLQWSKGRKNQALRLIGKENYKIEDLSLEDQLEIIARELEGPYKNTLEGIRKCKTASEAAATMYCHNVGSFSNSNLPASQQEIDKVNKMYSKFTGNNPDNLIVNRGIKYAENLLLNG